MRAPMLALLAELEDEFGPGSCSGRTGTCGSARTRRRTRPTRRRRPAGYYLSLSADGLFLGGGIYHPAPDQLDRMRRAVADDVQGAALERIVVGWPEGRLRGQRRRMTRPPRGYPPDHPRAELLKHRSLVGHRHWEPGGWLHTRTALTRVRESWRRLAPLTEWVGANVGESDQPRR